MLLTVLIAVELGISLVSLAVIGTEPADRAETFRRARPDQQPGLPASADLPLPAASAPAAPVRAAPRSPVHAQPVRRLPPQRRISRRAAPRWRPAAAAPGHRSNAMTPAKVSMSQRPAGSHPPANSAPASNVIDLWRRK